jgi:murein DD-endopeptidase MepM/ murein hydrolase activator NlpD
MKKQRRKKYFSFIFVPDQDKDPKSISMSYAKGQLILAIMIILGIHMIIGGVNYYRIGHIEEVNTLLEDENKKLKTKNKKIERIFKEFQEIRLIDEKIRMAFGGTLGLRKNSSDIFQDTDLSSKTSQTIQTVSPVLGTALEPDSEQMKKSLYFLSEKKGDYFDPDYIHKGGWFIGRTHWGIDIAAKKGSVIRAAGSGIVILADWTPQLGNIVVISHGRGLYSYYGHAMRLFVEQGLHIKKGQSVALLGSSGSSSAPHLHFEIWKDGEPLDPEKFLYAVQSRKEES